MENEENTMSNEMNLLKWILFLQDPYGEEIRKIAEKDEIIKMALDELEKLNNDEEVVRIAKLRERQLREQAMNQEYAREKDLTKVRKKLLKR